MVRDEQRNDPGPADEPADSQNLLRAYGTEFVLVVSPAGEILAGSHDTMLGYTTR